MKIGWLEKLRDLGLIRGYKVMGDDRVKLKLPKKKSVGKEWIDNFLSTFKVGSLSVTVYKEYRFDNDRKWRFDWALVAWEGKMKIAIEYEGIFSKKSRHTTKSGYSGDVEKYNAAAQAGWKVLRYTAKNYTNIENDLKKIFLCD